MTPLPEEITRLTRSVARRWRVQYALAWSVVSVVIIAGAFVGRNIVEAVTGWSPAASYVWTFALTIGLGLPAWAISHRPSSLLSAQLIDQHFALKGRTAAAVQFAALPLDPVRELQLADARDRVVGLSAAEVIPITFPHGVRWAALAVGICLATTLLPHPSASADTESPAVEVVDAAAAADSLAEQLKQMQEIAEASGMDDLDELILDLDADLDLLRKPDNDIRQALTTVSRMQQKMKAMAASLNTAKVDQQLEDVSEALSGAEDFRTAADALRDGDLENAADALDRLDNPQLSAKERTPTAEKLSEAAEAARQRDLDDLAETLDDLAEGVSRNDADQMQQSSRKLADDVREQNTRRKVSQMLTNKAEAFGQTKRMIRAKGNRSGNGGASGKGLNLEKGKTNREATGSSQKAGSKSAGNIDGEKTRLDGRKQMARLKGQLSQQGDSEKETESGGESEERATRDAREVFAEYQKLSDAVLDSESIPLGHRETIRRYFELIRPTADTQPQ